MIPKEERYMDKAGWVEGPWMTEPDRVEWHSSGLPCLIVRSEIMGSLCGYVGVPPGHRWYGKHSDDIDVHVHGGVTFTASCDEGGHICHVPQPGEAADVWWIGFDCGHSFDFMYMRPHFADSGLARLLGDVSNYRDVAYVHGEVEQLAAQCV